MPEEIADRVIDLRVCLGADGASFSFLENVEGMCVIHHCSGRSKNGRVGSQPNPLRHEAIVCGFEQKLLNDEGGNPPVSYHHRPFC